jgi:hypothetical protein
MIVGNLVGGITPSSLRASDAGQRPGPSQKEVVRFLRRRPAPPETVRRKAWCVCMDKKRA